MKITNLRCEYLVNPIGIDVPRPRFSWQLQSEKQGAKQTACQIVAEAIFPLKANAKATGVLWDSDKISSSQSVHVEYGGPDLASGQRVTWKVRVWDEDGKPSEYSEPAWFEMGLLKQTD